MRYAATNMPACRFYIVVSLNTECCCTVVVDLVGGSDSLLSFRNYQMSQKYPPPLY